MDERIKRFKQCEPRFYPHLERVLERLPADVSERVLNDKELQIIADEDLIELCVLRYRFEHPVRNIIYLNTKVLMEPEHQLIHTLAHELALYIIGEGETEEARMKAEDLLTQWGFEREIEAVRYDKAIAESDGYQTGYSWARKQSKDYLLRHFGLYFDEWNEKGLKRMSRQQLEKLQSQAAAPILGEMAQVKEKDASAAMLRRDEAIIAGIMAAVKEIRFEEVYGAKKCTTGNG
jgi:hypothetical protein